MSKTYRDHEVFFFVHHHVREDAISDVTSVSSPTERLLAAQVDPSEVFDLRFRSLQARTRFRQSEVRGFLGGRNRPP